MGPVRWLLFAALVWATLLQSGQGVPLEELSSAVKADENLDKQAQLIKLNAGKAEATDIAATKKAPAFSKISLKKSTPLVRKAKELSEQKSLAETQTAHDSHSASGQISVFEKQAKLIRDLQHFVQITTRELNEILSQNLAEDVRMTQGEVTTKISDVALEEKQLEPMLTLLSPLTPLIPPMPPQTVALLEMLLPHKKKPPPPPPCAPPSPPPYNPPVHPPPPPPPSRPPHASPPPTPTPPSPPPPTPPYMSPPPTPHNKKNNLRKTIGLSITLKTVN